jgi:hypothetical protein
MAFHDKLAQHAFRSGKASSQFHLAAQKHANATWVYIIIGAIVWWVVSWVWALVPFAIGAFVAFQSVSATMIASRLEKFEAKFKS